ncbi:MAG TPA: RecQ family ATP-dependent DNA helicase [Candidatus Dormibacteraeota bacterium]|nr:RecQ family ATP-dependent DNA helicase [Candidatus Dormibacteraeota bacterium]
MSQRDAILDVVRRYWGFDQLRPMQEAAIAAGLEGRDALVVLPTGGGKSLCYQVPPAVAGRTDVVVSPLIALMKDQVDGLRENGYPAAALHSGMALDEVREVEEGLAGDRYRLLFVAPERLLMPRFLTWLERAGVRNFAIDEAHCISHWGHDFRPEYRQLAELKTRIAGVSIRAFTATATERVRADVAAQLRLDDPLVLVGTFDRPNLTYRVVPRSDTQRQVLQVLRRHPDEAAIVYCLSRKDTETLAAQLVGHGIRAAHYHAGMESGPRHRTQEAFAEEKLDVVVATVAFGMGIDRSDVRCVIHTALPKSIEHYQQETGRAGRDGLEAECVLLYSGSDVVRLERLLERSAGEAAALRGEGDATDDGMEATRQLLRHMQRFASGLACRHKTLSEYFGQAYEREGCGACDVCLEEVEGVGDATVTAQKILSAVARAEGFGVTHIVDILVGADTERIRGRGHEQLSTYGLLKELPRGGVTAMVHQLVDQRLLERTVGDRPVLRLTPASWEVLRGRRGVQLVQPRAKATPAPRLDGESWEGVDRDLFDHLRQLRRGLAEARGVPPYIIFNDATLRDLARRRPTSLDAFAGTYGVGERKLHDLGPVFVEHIRQWCEAH